MKIAYVICRSLVNIAFIAMSIFLTVWYENFHFLWFLTVPIISHLMGLSFTSKSEEKDKSNTEEIN